MLTLLNILYDINDNILFILGVVYINIAQKNPKITLDEYEYLIYRKELNKTVWKCCHYFRSKENRCKSTLVTTGRVVTVSADIHNHPVDLKKNTKNMLSQKVTIIRDSKYYNCYF